MMPNHKRKLKEEFDVLPVYSFGGETGIDWLSTGWQADTSRNENAEECGKHGPSTEGPKKKYTD